MTYTKRTTDRRASWALALVLGLCTTGFALMAALHLYAFVWKTAVVPLLLLAALVSRRLHRFIDDWAVFLGAVIMFDFCRGFIFALITHFGLPVHLGYVIDWERALCGGRILPAVLQSWRAGLTWAPAIDRTLTLFHGSHFAYFLLFGMAVWLLRPESFRRYVTAVLLLIYAGLCFYLILPTVPPWMASAPFGAIPPVTHISWEIYNVTIPPIQQVFDVNPIAAMPSLHAALPTLCTLIGLQLFGWHSWPMVVYTFMIYLAVTFLGEHYLVDVLAGGLLATAVYVAVFRFDLGVRRGMRSQMIRPVLLSVLLITVAEGLGQATIALQYPWQDDDALLEKEIAVGADVVHYYRGHVAYDAGEFDVASREFAAALAARPQPADQRDVRMWLGRSAFRAGAYPTVIAALEPLREHAAPADILTLLGVAYLNDGRADQGMTILTDLTRRFPTDPEPLYWLTRFRYLQRQIGRSEVLEVVERMEHLPDRDRAASFQHLLLQTLDADGGS
jgi:hypothetical protein